MSKVKEYQVEIMVDTLCSNMMSDKEQLRDISSMGLKTVIAELPPCSAGTSLFMLLLLLYKLHYSMVLLLGGTLKWKLSNESVLYYVS